MPASSYPLEELIPHREPMVLIDEIVSFDEATMTLVASMMPRPEWTSSCAAIEYMAQASAALAGLSDKLNDPASPPRPGFLLGTRKLELLLSEFKRGERYLIMVKNEFNDGETASFACEICLAADSTIVAKANLTAYRPEDITKFVTEG